MILPRHFSIFASIVIAAIAVAGCSDSKIKDPRFEAPVALYDEAVARGGKAIFLNPTARRALIASGRDFEPPTSEEQAAAGDASRWRKLDRRHRFEAVVLAGQPAGVATLLTHMLRSPDFRLSVVDNWGFLFTRGLPAPYSPPPVGEAGAGFSDAADRARYLAQMAVMLDLIGERTPAREYIEKAAALAPDDAGIHARQAYLHLQHQQLREAIESADRALDLERGNLPALQIKTQALAASGSIEKAWSAAERLKSIAPPKDMESLFLHARMANLVRAYQSEQDSLERLVAAAKETGVGATDYHVYLGQCYAKQNKPGPALEQFESALKADTLSASQRTDIETAIATIKAKTGGGNGD